MSRNLKGLGLALVAALALGAIGAQGASAVVNHDFTSEANSTVWTGTQDTNLVFKTQTGGATIQCTSATLSGTVTGDTVDQVTLHPKYSGHCSSSVQTMGIDTDGCNYILDSDTTTGGHFSGEHATTSLECEAGHAIKTTGACTFTFSAAHGSVPVNQSLHGIRYNQVTHSGKSSLTVEMTAGSIHYTTSGGFACGVLGKPDGTYSTGTYEGNFSVTGYAKGISTGTTTSGTTWHHGAQVNISLSTPT